MSADRYLVAWRSIRTGAVGHARGALDRTEMQAMLCEIEAHPDMEVFVAAPRTPLPADWDRSLILRAAQP